MTSLAGILAVALVLGVRHALDADHLVVVGTIVSEYKNPFRATWAGVSWGLGHATTLFLVGAVILFLDLHIPNKVSLFFEFGAGAILMLLGVQALLRCKRSVGKLGPHRDSYETTGPRADIATNAQEKPGGLLDSTTPAERKLSTKRDTRPSFRVKSYAVGAWYGLGGSAAIMLLVLVSIRSNWHGIIYLLAFGIANVVSMGIIAALISLPFSTSGNVWRLNRVIQIAAGVLGIVFGLVLMYQAGIIDGLLLRIA